jgi:hypothetical protein
VVTASITHPKPGSGAPTSALESTVFLLSPAKLSGVRGNQLQSRAADFDVARRLRSAEGAPLGDVFSFVSGLYFRGKMSYALKFGRAPDELPSAFVMTAGGGLCLLDERVSLERVRNWAAFAIHEHNPHFTAPLIRHASALLNERDPATRFVLLGSVASNKYVTPLLDIFAERLLFPTQFLGLGDMSRGALLLRATQTNQELPYSRVTTALPHGGGIT